MSRENQFVWCNWLDEHVTESSFYDLLGIWVHVWSRRNRRYARASDLGQKGHSWYFFRSRIVISLEEIWISWLVTKAHQLHRLLSEGVVDDSVSSHFSWIAAAAKSLQSCPTLCDPIDGSPPGSPVPGILQARTLEWVAISFSNASKWKVKVK